MATGNDYYDILLIGRTGQGKSTTGNKLLKIVANEEEPIPTNPEEDDKISFFVTKSGWDSCTKYCKVLSKPGEVRVLDTPGFADSRKLQGATVYEANLGIMRDIMRNQQNRHMKFSRILYFLPQRGPLKRADGTFQEEIKVMYGYFGTVIFDIMVIIATNDSGVYQQCGFPEDAMKTTEVAFMKAFENTTGKQTLNCPPILYLPLDETDVLGKVKDARVLNDRPLLALTFNERCAKCANKLVYLKDAENKKVLVRVVINEDHSDQKEVDVDESMCHPCFIPKHSTLKKVAGGLAHTLTLGVPLLFEKMTNIETWPGFTNTDEICPACENPPGSKPCRKIKTMYTQKSQKITTQHSIKMLEYGTYT